MSVAIPETLEEALQVAAADPEVQVLAGGTDLMVEVNFGYRRPASVCALHRIAELHAQRQDDGEVVIGAMTTYHDMERGVIAAALPGLAQAGRTVGSPQIRNAGTVGGNLATASPPATRCRSSWPSTPRSSWRRSPAAARCRSPTSWSARSATLGPGELIAEVRVPHLRGPQEFLKVGARNAMVIAVCSLALVVDLERRRVACALGSVGPTVLRAFEAEERAAQEIDWQTGRLGDPAFAPEFGRLVAAAARPIDDHRSTAGYRRHAIGVLAERALRRSA